MPPKRGRKGHTLSTEDLLDVQEDALAQRVREEQRAVVKDLLSVLLAPVFDEDAVAERVKRLESLEVPMSRIQDCFLSRLCFHVALADVQTDEVWKNLQKQWVEGFERLGISTWAIGLAIASGHNFATKTKKAAHGITGAPEALAKAVYMEFFDSDKVLEGL
ncbi:MAG: hypothetical protein UY52_C0014G0045 [Parcubacteria group bacterium GW2011_GWC2_49_9]|nr:MAG: hypothetical protein UY52_C0014G0045 [Parcubacteria group bacterium GW2011_GWC2_49_9]